MSAEFYIVANRDQERGEKLILRVLVSDPHDVRVDVRTTFDTYPEDTLSITGRPVLDVDDLLGLGNRGNGAEVAHWSSAYGEVKPDQPVIHP
jgi:hypothetical protein